MALITSGAVDTVFSSILRPSAARVTQNKGETCVLRSRRRASLRPLLRPVAPNPVSREVAAGERVDQVDQAPDLVLV